MYPAIHRIMLPHPPTSRSRGCTNRNPRLLIAGFLFFIAPFLHHSQLFRKQGREQILTQRSIADRFAAPETSRSENEAFSAGGGLDVPGDSANDVDDATVVERLGAHSIFANQLKENANDDVEGDGNGDDEADSVVNDDVNAFTEDEVSSPGSMSNSSRSPAIAVIESADLETENYKTTESTATDTIPDADTPADSKKQIDISSNTDVVAQTAFEEASAHGDSIAAAEKEASLNTTDDLLPADLNEKQSEDDSLNTTLSGAEVEPQVELRSLKSSDSDATFTSDPAKQANERDTIVSDLTAPEVHTINKYTTSSMKDDAEKETTSGEGFTIKNSVEKGVLLNSDSNDDERSNDEDAISKTSIKKKEANTATGMNRLVSVDSEMEEPQSGQKTTSPTTIAEALVPAPVSEKIVNDNGADSIVENGDTLSNDLSFSENQKSALQTDPERDSEKPGTAVVVDPAVTRTTIDGVNDDEADEAADDGIGAVANVQETAVKQSTNVAISERETTGTADSIAVTSEKENLAENPLLSTSHEKEVLSVDSSPANEDADDTDMDMGDSSISIADKRLTSPGDMSESTQNEKGAAKVVAAEKEVENESIDNAEDEEGNE